MQQCYRSPFSREENNMGKQAFYPENELRVDFYLMLLYLIIFFSFYFMYFLFYVFLFLYISFFSNFI